MKVPGEAREKGRYHLLHIEAPLQINIQKLPDSLYDPYDQQLTCMGREGRRNGSKARFCGFVVE